VWEASASPRLSWSGLVERTGRGADDKRSDVVGVAGARAGAPAPGGA
jgi:hypothetical protein